MTIILAIFGLAVIVLGSVAAVWYGFGKMMEEDVAAMMGMHDARALRVRGSFWLLIVGSLIIGFIFGLGVYELFRMMIGG